MIAVYHKPVQPRHGRRWRVLKYRNLLLAALLTFCAVQARRSDGCSGAAAAFGSAAAAAAANRRPAAVVAVRPVLLLRPFLSGAVQMVVMFSYYRRITASKASAAAVALGLFSADCYIPPCLLQAWAALRFFLLQ